MANNKIILISCSKKKGIQKNKAEHLYQSPLFKSSYTYAKNQKPQAIYILSAKYGLLSPDTIIEPYNQTLNKMKIAERKKWSENIIYTLKDKHSLENDIFIILAGKKYYEYFIKSLSNIKLPLEHLKIGERLRKLNNIR